MSTYQKESFQLDVLGTNIADNDAIAQWDAIGYTDALIKITVFAKSVDDRAWITQIVTIESYGGGTNIIGTPQVLYDQRDTGASSWTADITIEDDTLVTVTCTGDGSATIAWYVKWDILEYKVDIPYP